MTDVTSSSFFQSQLVNVILHRRGLSHFSHEFLVCFNSDDLDSESIYGHLEEPLEINPTEDDPEAGMSDMQGFKITMLLY